MHAPTVANGHSAMAARPMRHPPGRPYHPPHGAGAGLAQSPEVAQ
jgi:hypothetical protein